MIALFPGIVDLAVMGVGRGGAVGEFLEIGLAEDDGASGFEALDDRGVVIGHPVLKQERAIGGERAFRGVEILHRDRDAVQRAEIIARCDRLLRRLRLLPGMIRHDRDEAVERAVEALDARKRKVGKLDRRDLLRRDERGEISDRGVGEFFFSHRIRTFLYQLP